jgi:hypothetical protein
MCNAEELAMVCGVIQCPAARLTCCLQPGKFTTCRQKVPLEPQIVAI